MTQPVIDHHAFAEEVDNPFKAIAERLRQAPIRDAVICALACIRRASAVLEAANVPVEDHVPFGQDSIGSINAQAGVPSLRLAVMRAQPALAGFAADPETGEVPGDEDDDRAELLAYVAEMVLRAESDAGDEDLRDWANWCSTLLLDACQHLDTLDDAEPHHTAGMRLGPLTAVELNTQADILSVLWSGPADATHQVSELTETTRTRLLSAASDCFWQDRR